MKRLRLLLLVFLLLPLNARADIPLDSALPERIHEPAAAGAGASACTIVYYNFCSGWLWIYDQFDDHDEFGVIFDLAADCGLIGDHHCCYTGGFWYWRWTITGYVPKVEYSMYEVDPSTGCRVGGALGSVVPQDPVERWNFVPDMGCTQTDSVMLVARMLPLGTHLLRHPRPATDSEYDNAQGGPACAGVSTGVPARSFYLGNDQVQYCPPLPFTDPVSGNPVNLLAQGSFDCQQVTATHSASWSEIKKLFQ